MGIDTSVAQFLFAAKALRVDFSRTLMLGRQFFYPDEAALAEMFAAHGITTDARDFIRTAGGVGDDFFRLLGADALSSLDASPFEGADIVHDMNQQISDSLAERFTVVFDGGTLEHVFHLPQALANCMNMLSVGGTLIQIAPANNFMGHGFYQVSPELVYRLFSPANGFEIVAVLMYEAVRGGRWFSVRDPAAVGRRVQMTNRLPVSLCTIARRTHRCDVLAESPQQSDYERGWQRGSGKSGGVYRASQGAKARASGLLAKYLPPAAERLIRTVYTPRLEAQPDCFRRVHASDVTRGTLD